MICTACKDTGTIPVGDDRVARCPKCDGDSYIASMNRKYERQSKVVTVIVVLLTAVVVVAIGVALGVRF